MCVLACRLELKWSQENPYVLFCVCVDDVVRLGVEPWRGCNFFFFLPEGLKMSFFWHCQVEKAVWYKLFVNLVYTSNPSIHMTRRFVIQGYPASNKMFPYRSRTMWVLQCYQA